VQVTTIHDLGGSAAAQTTARYRVAAETGDLERFMATLSPDVVFNSPITALTSFEGHDQVRSLMEAVFATVEDIRYTVDIGDERVRALVHHGEISGQAVHEATIVRLNERAEIVEVTFWVRPLPALTALAAALGPKLARRNGRIRSVLLKAMARPLFWLTRAGDSIGVRLAR
jgi:SnoaL-like domain